MTKSLSLISTCEHPVILNSLDFIKAIRETLDSLLSGINKKEETDASL